MNQTVAKVSQVAEETREASERLNELAKNLTQAVEKFKT